MMALAMFAAAALCLGLLALLARMAEEGFDFGLPVPSGMRAGWQPQTRRPAGWADRLAKACKATARHAAKLASKERQERVALAAVRRACDRAERKAGWERPLTAPLPWPAERPAHRHAPSGTWLAWADGWMPVTLVPA